jgi:carbon monoxide dehydrogenase subunit G
MNAARYRFDSTWTVAAPPAEVFAAVVDLGAYPKWWPEVRAVRQIDDDEAELEVRAALPYRLRLRMRRAVQDEAAGKVQVEISGDLAGVLRGDLHAVPGGTRLRIRQDVALRKPLLVWFERVARPVYRINHTVMMRRGLRGLNQHLVG